jgi:hypothetical protein
MQDNVIPGLSLFDATDLPLIRVLRKLNRRFNIPLKSLYFEFQDSYDSDWTYVAADCLRKREFTKEGMKNYFNFVLYRFLIRFYKRYVKKSSTNNTGIVFADWILGFSEEISSNVPDPRND